MLKSSEGLSIWFLLIWLGGDAFNLFGGLLQGVLWTMIILAGYYCFCDLLLIYQWWYYGKYYENGVYKGTQQVDEETPLVSGATAVHGNAATRTYDALVKLTDQWTGHHATVFRYSLTVVLILLTGTLAWFSADPVSTPPPPTEGDKPTGLRVDAQTLGWLSAILYLSSRLPQIIKNKDTKCAGLSLALFVFAVGGNVTYVRVRIRAGLVPLLTR